MVFIFRDRVVYKRDYPSSVCPETYYTIYSSRRFKWNSIIYPRLVETKHNKQGSVMMSCQRTFMRQKKKEDHPMGKTKRNTPEKKTGSCLSEDAPIARLTQHEGSRQETNTTITIGFGFLSFQASIQNTKPSCGWAKHTQASKVGRYIIANTHIPKTRKGPLFPTPHPPTPRFVSTPQLQTPA